MKYNTLEKFTANLFKLKANKTRMCLSILVIIRDSNSLVKLKFIVQPHNFKSYYWINEKKDSVIVDGLVMNNEEIYCTIKMHWFYFMLFMLMKIWSYFYVSAIIILGTFFLWNNLINVVFYARLFLWNLMLGLISHYITSSRAYTFWNNLLINTFYNLFIQE